MEEIQLTNVHVENFRSLVNTDLKINSEITALIGVNGSGKTNTLSAIKLLRQLTSGRYRHAKYGIEKEELAPSVIIASFLYKNVSYRLKANVFLDDSIENDGEVKYFELSVGTGESEKWEILNPDVFDYIGYLQKRDAPVSMHKLERQYLPTSQKLKDFVFALSPYLHGIKYYGATVFSDPSKCPVSFEIDEDRMTPHRFNRSGHLRFLYDLYELKNTDLKAFKRYLNSVNDIGVGLIDNIYFEQIDVPNSSIKILTGGQTKKINNKRTVVVPVFTLNNLQLSPNQLSEGTFKTLALIFYVLNDKSPLMLIEEPEVCVHHGLLASVVELIKQKSRDKQIIISTHSDYVLDRMNPENVSLVKKEGEGTVIEPLSEALSAEDYAALKKYLDESGNLGEYWKEDGFSFE